MDLDTLRYGKFGTLATAVSDWSALVKKLETLEKDAKEGLKGLADKAKWKGSNATVSKEFITKTAGEFSDAHTEATTVHNILKDTHDELVEYQKQLNNAIADGLKKNLTVMDLGDGTWTVTMNIHPDRAGKGTDVPEHTTEDEDALRGRVQRIMKGATESDDSAAKVLDELMQQAQYGFSDVKYKDRDTAAKAVEDAEKYANLIKKKGDDMSPKEFDDLNKILAAHKGDPLFQEKFAETLGPRGMLNFWADLADGSDGSELYRSRHDQFGELQKNLGMTLAGATQSDSPAMRKWENEMVDLGDQRIKTRGANVYGFQLMSNLMRVGNYDDKFLDDYGNKLVATEKKMKMPDHYWNTAGGGPMPPKMNFIGDDDFGRDPMTGFMQGLSRSPDAATTFFNETKPQDNAEWVLKDRPVFDDSPLNDDDGNLSREATGKALFAATTGMDPNDPHAPLEPHTDATRHALDRSLKYLSETGDDFPSEMRDDMAKVLVNYGDEYHHTASSLHDDPNDPRQLNREQLMEVSKQISRSQDAYGVLNEGINHEIVGDIYNDHPKDPRETLQRAGATVGFLEEARYQAMDTDKEDPSWKAKWGYHIVGGAFNFVPVVGDAAQRGVDAAAYAWQLDEQDRIDGEQQEQTREVFGGREKQLAALAQQWEKVNPDAMKEHGYNSYTLEREINGDAFDGNQRAKRLGGEH